MNQITKMNWISSTTKKGFEMYELWNEDQKLMTLEFNQFSQTAKVECLNSRRIFKIDKEGFLGNKTILKNEYGIKIGEIDGKHWYNHDGIIELNEENFHYKTINSELIIYKKHIETPLLSCGIDIENSGSTFNVEKHKEAEKYSIFLVALAWFLFLPNTKETFSNSAFAHQFQH